MSIFSIFFHLDDFFAWFTCTPKTYVKSTPRRSKNWRLSIVHRKSNCRTEPRPTFFFLMVGGGVNPLRLPNFLISSVRSIEKVLFSNSWILKVRNPSFISTKSHLLVCNSGTKEDILSLSFGKWKALTSHGISYFNYSFTTAWDMWEFSWIFACSRETLVSINHRQVIHVSYHDGVVKLW